MNIVHKTATAIAVDGAFEFVMSDATQDRLGDIVDSTGWDLSDFSKNPIALFGHGKHDPLPIGTWSNLRVERGALKGKLNFAKPGTSARIDEIRSLAEQGILRAVSVGFRPLEAEPLPVGKGIRYKRNKLVECSLVTIPANPNAIQIARSLNISDDTMNFVFGEQAMKDAGAIVHRHIGEQAANPPAQGRARTMTTPLSTRIENAQTEIVHLKDLLNVEVEKEEADPVVIAEITSKIETKEAAYEGLKRAEAVLATKAVTVAVQKDDDLRRPFAVPAKKVAPGDHVLRSIVGMLVSKASGGRKSPEQVIAERYGEDGKFNPATDIVLRVATRSEHTHPDDIVLRAASAPATTTTSGWASHLVDTSFAGFRETLMPASVYPGLASRGVQLSFGRSGVISVPSRVATPTIAGSFVAEGSPIPVRQGAFTSLTFTPKKMAVITTFTREIAEHSTPALEGLLRDAIREDTSVAMDTVLLDATVASTTRPAGLKAGVAAIAATAGGTFTSLVTDMKNLVGALITGSAGHLRSPVWITNPVNALAISVTQNAGGDFPFAQEINAGMFQGYPMIISPTVTAGNLFLVDVADFVAIEGGAPRFDVSDQATLHMEDTTPLAIGTAGTPATVAAPVRSLYQTDSMALRMVMDVNWGMRRTGVVHWTETVTW